MKLLGWLLFGIAAAVAYVSWTRLALVESERQALQAALQQFQTEKTAVEDAESLRLSQELDRLRAETKELLQLRSEVTQLRSGAREMEKLRAENSQLRASRQSQSSPPQTVAATPASTASSAGDHFPREGWSFAGYASPEAALVSAIWAMREGNPQTYLESLAPNEQLRMAKVWENKTESEIAAKHQQDVSAITGMRVLGRVEFAPDEVHMNVYVEGVNRLEKVAMKRVGNDWKFGGYIREPAAP